MSKVARAALIVLIINLISRILGFVRDAVIAYEFGASGATDAYMVAYTLPYSLQAVLGMAFATVMVPVVTNYLIQDKKEEGWYLVSSVLNLTTVVLGAVTLLGMLFAPQLVRLMAPGFDGETVALTAHLSRIMFPSIIFMGLGMLITGVLNACKKFTIPALAPAFANIIIILTVIFFGATYRLQGLAVGTLVGFIGFMLIQLPNLRQVGFKYSWVLEHQNPEVQKIFLAIIPMTLSIAVNQILLAVNRFFASGLMSGSITALDYANRLMNLPLGILVAAVTTAIYPALAEGVAKKDYQGLGQTLTKGLGTVTVAILPAALGLMALKVPVVRLLFERGAFDSWATEMTATALFYFCLGLWFVALNMVLTRVFYAFEDLKTPLFFGLLSIGINILFSLLLLPVLDHGGLALANSLAAGINTWLLYRALRSKIPSLDFKPVLQTTGKSLLAASIMAVVVIFLDLNWVIPVLGTLGLLLKVLFLAGLGAALYALLVVALKVEEAQWFIQRFRSKTRRGR